MTKYRQIDSLQVRELYILGVWNSVKCCGHFYNGRITQVIYGIFYVSFFYFDLKEHFCEMCMYQKVLSKIYNLS